MPKIREGHKITKRAIATIQSSAILHYTDNSLLDFAKKQTDELNSLRQKLNETNTKLLQTELELYNEKEKLKMLQQSNNDKATKIYQLKENKQNLHTDYIILKTKQNEHENKYCTLEIAYNQEIKKKNLEIEDLRTELQQNLQIQNNKVQEFSDNLQKLKNQLTEAKQTILNITKDKENLLANVESLNQELKNSVNCQTKEALLLKEELEKSERLEIKISDLQAELQNKDETIKLCQTEKDELEDNKNEVIKELQYKVQEIQRTICQPVKAIGPTVSTNQGLVQGLTKSNNQALVQGIKNPNCSEQQTSTMIQDTNRQFSISQPIVKFHQSVVQQVDVPTTSNNNIFTIPIKSQIRKNRHRFVKQSSLQSNQPHNKLSSNVSKSKPKKSINVNEMFYTDEDDDEYIIPVAGWRPMGFDRNRFTTTSESSYNPMNRKRKFPSEEIILESSRSSSSKN